MWMGGVPPLGYRVEDRKLLVLDAEAELVRLIFRRYADLGSVRLVKQELEARGSKSKSWTSASGRRIGDKPFSRGALYQILQNRTYLGEIVHKGQSYPGEHTPPPRERVVRPTTRRKILQGVNKIKLPQGAHRPSDNEQGRFVGRKLN